MGGKEDREICMALERAIGTPTESLTAIFVDGVNPLS